MLKKKRNKLLYLKRPFRKEVKTEFCQFWKVSVVHWPKAKQKKKMKIKSKKEMLQNLLISTCKS